MKPVSQYDLRAFFKYVVDVLERQQIPYMVVGGFAAILHGEPRLTIDVDIIVDMQPLHISRFAAAFPLPNYYVSIEGIRDSLQRRYPFNVIQSNTGAKVDLVPLPRDLFSQAAFSRRQPLTYDTVGNTAMFITPEDIIVAKLIAHRETGSDKHLRDIRGVLVTQWGSLELETIRQDAQASRTLEQFEELFKTVTDEME